MPAEGFAADAEAVIEAIYAYRDATARRRSIGTAAELTQSRDALRLSPAHP